MRDEMTPCFARFLASRIDVPDILVDTPAAAANDIAEWLLSHGY
jgi:hypothetical protein